MDKKISLLGNYDRPTTDQQTNQPTNATDQHTYMLVH